VQNSQDLADARHLELVFQGPNPAKIENYRALFEENPNEGKQDAVC